jgi:predicted nucleic acid-binding protein
MSDDLVFVDTNVLVSAYDADAGPRHERAKEAMTRLWMDENGALSTQVLQEFYVTVTRKLPKPLTRVRAREIVATYGAWLPYRPAVEDVMAAAELEGRHRLAFWDALIIVSAQSIGASVVLSEDLQNGRRFAGLRVSNPFVAAAPVRPRPRPAPPS